MRAGYQSQRVSSSLVKAILMVASLSSHMVSFIVLPACWPLLLFAPTGLKSSAALPFVLSPFLVPCRFLPSA